MTYRKQAMATAITLALSTTAFAAGQPQHKSFQDADSNSDNSLNYSEAQKALDLDRDRFDQADVDNSQSLSQAEFDNARMLSDQQQQTVGSSGTSAAGTTGAATGTPKSNVDVDRISRDESARVMQKPGSETGGAMQGSQQPGIASMSTTVEHLKGMEVQTRGNEEIGNVTDIVSDAQTGQLYAIISVGGVMGLGDKKVPVQLDQLQLQDDQLIASGVITPDELENRPEYLEANFREVDDDRRIDRAEFSAFEQSEPRQ